ncbi:MAG: hypothetical protein U9Q82_15505 [Chloroflexota bacterium]|nr:hypothetical protein [Chloroflexota bacterium]
MKPTNFTIGVVGVCGSGKSELVSRLRKRGYKTHHIAQEHSHVPSMWQKIVNPDILIFLEVSFPLTKKRKGFNWKRKEYQEQLRRLHHAISHADLRINTDELSPKDISNQVLMYIDTSKKTPKCSSN